MLGGGGEGAKRGFPSKGWGGWGGVGGWVS